MSNPYRTPTTRGPDLLGAPPCPWWHVWRRWRAWRDRKRRAWVHYRWRRIWVKMANGSNVYYEPHGDAWWVVGNDGRRRWLMADESTQPPRVPDPVRHETQTQKSPDQP
jgi:hypothetical protein